MPYGLYMSAEGAKAQSQRLEVLANNLANVNTVGFKPDVSAFQARFAEAIQEGQATPGDRSINDTGGGVSFMETRTNFSAGRLQKTGAPGDLAIIGNGFFQVAGPEDEPLLTRAGAFRLDSDGYLVTANGDQQVLDSSGAPVQVDSSLPWRVAPDGAIEQAGAVTPLAIVAPERLGDLHKVGANLFRSAGEASPVPLAQREVRQGYLEMSGVSPTKEMMSLIETSRAFEANTRLIQNQDSMLSSLIDRVLRSA